MRFFAVACLTAMLAAPAYAATDKGATPPPAPAAATTQNVALTKDEVTVLSVALANAGQACDQNVQLYCQISQIRLPLMQKLTTVMGSFPAASPGAAPAVQAK